MTEDSGILAYLSQGACNDGFNNCSSFVVEQMDLVDDEQLHFLEVQHLRTRGTF